ncbi:helix-turn-helix domain-containing protein [Candidatus Izemoplasma sp. B36]|uniref:helix-turn-helix domain-containing protein n=1 Tax=Candidatus Izemoplasma sp. B36 TaxID=3242468 RepID=UPI003558B470
MDLKVIKELFNPVRMKIILELTKRQECTTKDLKEELQDIPQASLYRHINILVKHEIIEITKEERKRGTIERTLKLKFDPYAEMQQSAETGDKKSTGNVFYYYVMTLLSEFNSYLNSDSANLIKDGVGFRSYPMYVTEEEHMEFIQDLGKLITKHTQKKSRKGRRLRKFSFVYIPGEEK